MAAGLIVGRIVFLSPFAKTAITGGIKTAYRHAELLCDLGFDACVFQPDGAPGWFENGAKRLTSQTLTQAPGDILVFPEVLNGILAEMAAARGPAKKVLFCQNQYYMAMNAMPAERYAELGFSRFATSSVCAKEFLERVLHLENVAIIPYHIDPGLFHPRGNAMQIALVPRKLPREAGLIRNMFQLKYPRLKSIAWQAIDHKSERETAEILGRSAVFLSLNFLESFGLVPVEAMASGAIVVGFHGYGGKEYATVGNGFWFPPDHLEEVVDALAAAISGIARNDASLLMMREAGLATAARYDRERTREALREFYGSL